MTSSVPFLLTSLPARLIFRNKYYHIARAFPESVGRAWVIPQFRVSAAQQKRPGVLRRIILLKPEQVVDRVVSTACFMMFFISSWVMCEYSDFPAQGGQSLPA